MYAHYFATGKNKTLLITSGPTVCLSTAKTIQVAGKKEARTKAAELNAKPWNF